MCQKRCDSATFEYRMRAAQNRNERNAARRTGPTIGLAAASYVAAVALALSLSACGGNRTELPPLAKDTRKLLTKDEQAKAISEIGKNKDDEIAAARKQIQDTK